MTYFCIETNSTLVEGNEIFRSSSLQKLGNAVLETCEINMVAQRKKLNRANLWWPKLSRSVRLH